MMPLPSLVVAALVHTSPLGRMVFTILTACGAAVSGYGVWLLWRDRTRVFDGPAAVWPYSEALWKGWVRSLPAQNVGFWAGVVLVRYGMWGPSDRGTGRVVVIAILAVAAGALAVAITVAYWNRPRFAVAPHLRSQPGALAEWHANWRARRARD